MFRQHALSLHRYEPWIVCTSNCSRAYTKMSGVLFPTGACILFRSKETVLANDTMSINYVVLSCQYEKADTNCLSYGNACLPVLPNVEKEDWWLPQFFRMILIEYGRPQPTSGWNWTSTDCRTGSCTLQRVTQSLVVRNACLDVLIDARCTHAPSWQVPCPVT